MLVDVREPLKLCDFVKFVKTWTLYKL